MPLEAARILRNHLFMLPLLAAVMVALGGCSSKREFYFEDEEDLLHYRDVATEIDYTTVCADPIAEAMDTLPPRTLASGMPEEFWDMPLQEAVQIALAQSDVIRRLGGQVITAPAGTPTIYDPAITETQPRTGVEATLAQFDAQLASNVFWARNDRALNNIFQGFGTSLLQADVGAAQTGVSKTAATGSEFSFRNNTGYLWNNVPSNRFASFWDTNFEAEFRQPLLQGAGIEFNRIAGPNSSIFFFNGVMLARIRTDISLADFEAGVADFVSDVENAYWELYLAYRDLDAKIAARNAGLATWRNIHTRFLAHAPGGEAEKEAQARANYFALEAQVQNALAGTLQRAVSSRVGSTGGEIEGSGGLYSRERQLRLLLGLPVNDGRFIRPSDEPVAAKIVFDWDAIVPEAMTRRVELRRQRWQIRNDELSLVAARNFLLPRLDAVSLYRWRGYGNQLIDPNSSGLPQFDNAFQTLFDGDFQEWELGLQMSMPIGFRQAVSGVRNAKTTLARDRAILRNQELNIVHNIAGALSELERSYELARTNFNRLIAQREQLASMQIAYDAQTVRLDELLLSQRQLADAEIDYFLSVTDYAVAVKNVHYQKGTLLDYNQVFLSEGPWPVEAYADARDRARDRAIARPMNYGFTRPQPVSAGAFPQLVLEPEVEGPPQVLPRAEEIPAQEDFELPMPLESNESSPDAEPRRLPSIEPNLPVIPFPSLQRAGHDDGVILTSGLDG